MKIVVIGGADPALPFIGFDVSEIAEIICQGPLSHWNVEHVSVANRQWNKFTIDDRMDKRKEYKEA